MTSKAGSNQYQTRAAEPPGTLRPSQSLVEQAQLKPSERQPTAQKLLAISDGPVRLRAIRDARLGPKQLAELAQSEDIFTLAGVAANESCPPELLARLADHRELVVQLAVGTNLNTPSEVLVSMLLSSPEKLTVGGTNANDQAVHALQNKTVEHPNLPAAVRAMWQLAHP